MSILEIADKIYNKTIPMNGDVVNSHGPKDQKKILETVEKVKMFFDNVDKFIITYDTAYVKTFLEFYSEKRISTHLHELATNPQNAAFKINQFVKLHILPKNCLKDYLAIKNKEDYSALQVALIKNNILAAREIIFWSIKGGCLSIIDNAISEMKEKINPELRISMKLFEIECLYLKSTGKFKEGKTFSSNKARNTILHKILKGDILLSKDERIKILQLILSQFTNERLELFNIQGDAKMTPLFISVDSIITYWSLKKIDLIEMEIMLIVLNFLVPEKNFKKEDLVKIDIILIVLNLLKPDQKFIILKLQNSKNESCFWIILKFATICYHNKIMPMIEILLKDLNMEQKFKILMIQNEYKRTIFHYYFEKEKFEAIKFIKQFSIDQIASIYKVPDYRGKTLLHLGLIDDPDIVKYIRSLPVIQIYEILMIEDNEKNRLISFLDEEILNKIINALTIEQKFKFLNNLILFLKVLSNYSEETITNCLKDLPVKEFLCLFNNRPYLPSKQRLIAYAPVERREWLVELRDRLLPLKSCLKKAK